MNEPMHLVARSDILVIMQLLQDSGATVDAVEYMDIYDRLDKITDSPPSNVAIKLVT